MTQEFCQLQQEVKWNKVYRAWIYYLQKVKGQGREGDKTAKWDEVKEDATTKVKQEVISSTQSERESDKLIKVGKQQNDRKSCKKEEVS